MYLSSSARFLFCRDSSMRIFHSGVNEIRDSFSSTSSQIYDKEKREQVKVILVLKPPMDSNKFLFDPVKLDMARKLPVCTCK